MFEKKHIENMLMEVIPSYPSEAHFEPYIIKGEPFFCNKNKTVVFPSVTFNAFNIYKEEDKYLRGINFQIEKKTSANTQIMLFHGTNKELSLIKPEEIINRIGNIAGKMLECLVDIN